MCLGTTHNALEKNLERCVRQGEFPPPPPMRRAADKLLLFENPKTGGQEFHHGAVFGLTRWTNLYFPLHQLFWGDAIGGPLAQQFGWHIEDVEVSTPKPPAPPFFTHTAYWSLACPGLRPPPQILA